MKLCKNIIYNLFTRKITIVKWQLNLIIVISFSAGILFTFGYLLNSYLLPKIFAATSPWTQTDWSGGQSESLATGTVTTYASISGTTNPSGSVTLQETSGWSNDYLNWGKRKAVTITNSDVEQTNYQIRLSITYDSDMQADFDDLRFTNSSGTAFDYWLETKTDSVSAIIWVDVDTLTASGTTTIYMYYGNSEATSTSSGVNTFTFFDNFDDNSFDTGKWTEADPRSKISESGGKLMFTYGSGSGAWDTAVYGVTSFTRAQWSFEWNQRWTSDYSPYDAFMFGWKDDGSGVSYTNLVYGYYNHGSGVCTTNCAGSLYEDGSSRTTSYTWSNNTDYKIRVRTRTAGGAYYEKSTDNGATWSTDYTSANSVEATLHPAWMLYSGDYQIDNVYIRKWLSTEPTSSFDSEVSKYQSSGYVTSNIFDSGFSSDWGTLSFTTAPSGSVTIKVRSSNSSTMVGATDFASCTGVTVGADLSSSGGCVTDTHRYIQYQATLEPSGANTPSLLDLSIAFSASDQTRPTTNATSISMTGIGNSVWTNTEPTITWTAGADNEGGGGLTGYCVSLDEVTITGTETSAALDPETSAGKLTGIDDGVTNNSTCGFIATGTSLNLSSLSGLTLTSGKRYYFSIKAVDLAGNVYTGTSATYQDLISFKYDDTSPSNTSYTSCASGNFSNVVDMSFSWPTSVGVGSSDSHSGVLGWQYQINSSSGTWQGTTNETNLDFDYIPATASAYILVQSRDESSINSGTNVIYFRTVDSVGNFSSDATIRTCNLSYGGNAPSFTGTDSVTVTPSTATSNSFALSWPAATPAGSNTVAHYYYMINTSPPSTLTTLQGNTSTYIDIGTSRAVTAAALSNVNKGTNTVYVVAIDNASTPNYSPSNYISGTFTLNSTDPDNVGNVVASDSSIKSSSQWNVTLTWTAPSYQGAGNLTYLIKRSTDNVTFAQVGSTSGLSYVDNTPSSTKYYYKIYTEDGADAQSSGTNAVSITPTGKWTSAPSLDSGPTAGSITTKKATITWTTSRSSDSKIQYGTSSGSYGSVEPSNSTQATSHSIQLTGLNPGTTYYYKAKWTDEDGNTGESSEKSFSTSAAPTVKDPKPKTIGLSSAIIQYTVKDASKVKIYYGKSSSFGGSTEVSTSISETTYTTTIESLEDGTKYYYKINTFDSESSEYEGSILTFETLPRPKISNVRIQQVANTAQSTILVSWSTNTEVSSIITYYPEGNTEDARDEVNVALTKGEHKMIIRGLLPQTPYTLIVKGRDKAGNEAVSDSQRFTTATDTRPPQISELKVEGSTLPSSNQNSQESTSQLIVSWNTDEPGTSQVEFGEGTGSTYSQKTQEDSNLTLNHLVIIPNLSPSKVYHLRSISKDKASNEGKSIDTVTITPKQTESALNLVITNLSQAFGFLGSMKK